jgi:glucan phosphoethanolaminetransferase (alkaline phosphatase superfamily)
MYTGLLHLHNVLRWVILILLLIAMFQAFAAKSRQTPGGLQKTSLFLLISSHITLLIGLYQYFGGPWGYKTIQTYGMSEVMKNAALRFWAVEHITGMIIAVTLITIARGKVKKTQYASASILYVVALLIILVTIPWPFRENVGRALFPGM